MRKRAVVGAAVAVSLTALVVPAPVSALPGAPVLYVGPGTPGGGSCDSPDFNDLGPAVVAIADFGTIHVCSGQYDLTSTIEIDKNVTFQGAGPEVSVITGSNKTVRMFEVTEDVQVTYNDMSLVEGMAGLVSGAPTGNGGAIRSIAGAEIDTSNVFFDSNKAVEGGAIWADGNVTVTGGRLTYNGNSSTTAGGAIYSDAGTVTLTGVTVAFNKATATAGEGGAVRAPFVSVLDSEFFANEVGSTGRGGALFGETSLSIVRGNFELNIAPGGYGGAAWLGSGALSVSQSGFRANLAAGGGALGATDSIVIDQSGFGENTATAPGGDSAFGGAAFAVGTSITATNSTFFSNSAKSGGGALQAGVDVSTVNVTFTGNTAPIGGSVLTTTLTADGTIFADSSTNPCWVDSSPTVDEGGNLALEADTSTDPDRVCPGTVTTVDALALQEPAENGGPTPTIALAPTSVAVDFDPDCAVAVDQRGFPRPFGGACDAGAYEWQPMPSAPPPWLLAVGRADAKATCPNGTSPSWAEWPFGGRGGYTCESAVVYTVNTGRWEVQAGFTTS